jgi:HSP20 family protein
MDEFMADFGRGPGWPRFDWAPRWLSDGGWRSGPAVNVAETDKAYDITAELPGIGPDNVTVTVADDVLTIQGEKKDEREVKEASYHLSERRFGSFRRDMMLPADADRDGIKADFDKGVLHVSIPKSATAPKAKARTIPIQAK